MATMGSMQWTAEESRYLKAIFTWQDRFDDEQDGRRARDATASACVGDFRVLMIGPKGVGKTALLTRFCDDTFRDAVDQRYIRGGRRPIRIDKLLYNMDVLEMPSQHLIAADEDDDGDDPERGPSPGAPTPAALMLEQALAITEAAIVVYDVCNPASFQQAQRLYNRLQRERDPHSRDQTQKQQQLAQGSSRSRKTVGQKRSMRFRSHRKKEKEQKEQKEQKDQKEQQEQQEQQEQARPPPSSASSTTTPQKALRRPFALLLVGNKSDVDDADRRVAWIQGSKATAVEAGVPGALHSGIPAVPPLPAAHKALIRRHLSQNQKAAVPATDSVLQAASTSTSTNTPVTFLEASAKTGDNVGVVFAQIGREILRERAARRRREGPKEPTEGSQGQEAGQEAGQEGQSPSSAASSTTNNTGSLLRMKSQASAGTVATRRTFGVLRVLRLSFGRRAVMETPAVV